MRQLTYRAPLALALAALVAASLVPLSGADTSSTFYDFRVGGPGDPTWTMLKLNVTRPGITPTVYYTTDEFHCPALWGTWFLTGSPADAATYNGLAFLYTMGRTGVDVYGSAFATVHEDEMEKDGTEHCQFWSVGVKFKELPLGTVYALTIATGVPFEGNARMVMDKPGVEIVGVSSGSTSVFRNETDFADGVGVVASGPPMCGMPEDLLVTCPKQEMNAGGVLSASAQVTRRAPVEFRHHPFFIFGYTGFGLTNASIQYPDGHVEYMVSPIVQPGPLYTLASSMDVHHMGPPPGDYYFDVMASAAAGTGAGWHIAGADVWFPEEAALFPSSVDPT